MAGYRTASYYIEQFPLVEILLQKGYAIDKKSSSSKWLVFKSQDHTDILLYNTKSKIYKNTQIENDKGNVLNFLANRVNGIVLPDNSKESFFKVFQELDRNPNIETPLGSKLNLEKTILKKELLAHTHNQEFNCKPIKEYKYLTEQRQISKQTLESPLFKGKIFNSYFILKNDHIITNYAFGKYKEDQLVGLEIRNKNLHIIEGKHDSLFYSNYDKGKKIDLVFIAESAIDALSYYELFKDNTELKDKNLLFISTGGNMYESLLDELINLFTYCKIVPQETKIISITDNDSAGLHYDHILLSAMISSYSENLSVSASTKDAYFYHYKINNIREELIVPIEKIVIKYNQQITQETLGSYVVLKTAEKTNFELNIPKDLGINSPFMIALKELLSPELRYYTHKPKSLQSDWNDVLVSKKKTTTITHTHQKKEIKNKFKI